MQVENVTTANLFVADSMLRPGEAMTVERDVGLTLVRFGVARESAAANGGPDEVDRTGWDAKRLKRWLAKASIDECEAARVGESRAGIIDAIDERLAALAGETGDE
jgi:hypothetical protein